MRRILVAAAVLLFVPKLAVAQRGGGSHTGATSKTDMFGNDPSTRRSNSVTSGKIRDLDPLSILIDKHKDMSLTDSQVAKLKSMNDQLGAAQEPAYHVLDSLNQVLSNLSSDDQERMQTTAGFVRMVAGNLRKQFDSVETEAKTQFTDDQKKKADDVLKDSHNDLAKLTGGRRDN